MRLDNDFTGERIMEHTAYFVVDDVAILYDGFDITDVEDYLKLEYPEAVAERNPRFMSDWLELLYDYAGTPELYITDNSGYLDETMQVNPEQFNRRQKRTFDYFEELQEHRNEQELNRFMEGVYLNGTY